MRCLTPGLLATALLAAPAAAAEVWLIGGGPDIEHSQEQIERGVSWLEDVLIARDLEVRTYFGLGTAPGKDVAYWDAAAGHTGRLEPLARIFGDRIDAGVAFRRHELKALEGSTIKDELVAKLRADFERHDARSDVLLVYTGHGGVVESDVQQNHLRIWGDRQLDVGEVDALLDRLPDGTTTRFVMSQCYSGAFNALMYEDPARGEDVDVGRCGFSSESALHRAEGCGLVIGAEQYSDYGTFLFEALRGETRNGESITDETLDRDGNGRTSFREAHLFTLANAHSSDLPRATSETYLVDWMPWYLRWDASLDGRPSVYWQLAERVAQRYGWETTPFSLEARRREFRSAQDEYRERERNGRDRVEELKTSLSADLVKRWPALARPYSPAYHRLLAERSSEIVRYVADDERYARLVSHQQQLGELSRRQTEVGRHLRQIDKIYRLRKLARLEQALARYGSRQERLEYEQLVECESGHLGEG